MLRLFRIAMRMAYSAYVLDKAFCSSSPGSPLLRLPKAVSDDVAMVFSAELIEMRALSVFGTKIEVVCDFC